jgi:ubiquitin conjugation factor E4 B
MHEILLEMLKSGAEVKESVLSWIGTVLDRNASRGRMRVDFQANASDGFFLTLNSVMLQLCLPFIDAGFTKTGMVNSLYIQFSKRFDLSKETRLTATDQEVGEWKSKQTAPAQFNFITECFFLTMRSLHLGLIKVFDRYNSLLRVLHENHSLRRELISRRSEWQGVRSQKVLSFLPFSFIFPLPFLTLSNRFLPRMPLHNTKQH